MKDQKPRKKKLIAFYTQHPLLQEKVEQLDEERKKFDQDVDFYKRKAMQAEKRYKARAKELWDDIEIEIDRLGILGEEKAKDVNMEIDRDLECIKRHDCNDHGIGSILGALLKH